MRWLAVFLFLVRVAYSDIVGDVRAASAKGDFLLGDSLVNSYRGQRGVTPEMLEALSWLARGALELKQVDRAEVYARETRAQVVAALKRRALDSDPHLAIALGAAIEVQATVLAARGERSEALAL